jgi:hypothetical protein
VKACDPDERKRWSQAVESRDAWIAELEAQAAKLGEGLPTPPTGLTEGLLNAGAEDLRSGVSVRSENRAEPEEQRTRWSDEYRQEALNYHCQIHGLPPADICQASGIPDPKSM